MSGTCLPSPFAFPLPLLHIHFPSPLPSFFFLHSFQTVCSVVSTTVVCVFAPSSVHASNSDVTCAHSDTENSAPAVLDSRAACHVHASGHMDQPELASDRHTSSRRFASTIVWRRVAVSHAHSHRRPMRLRRVVYHKLKPWAKRTIKPSKFKPKRDRIEQECGGMSVSHTSHFHPLFVPLPSLMQ